MTQYIETCPNCQCEILPESVCYSCEECGCIPDLYNYPSGGNMTKHLQRFIWQVRFCYRMYTVACRHWDGSFISNFKFCWGCSVASLEDNDNLYECPNDMADEEMYCWSD